MLLIFLWKQVESYHALTVSHTDLGYFGTDLLATADKRTFLLDAIVPGATIGHWLYNRETGN